MKPKIMKNCTLCSKKLRFMNTPTFGAGKLKDGGIVCTSCFNKINTVNPQVAFKLKEYTLDDVKNMLEEKAEKNTRIEVKSKPKATVGGIIVLILLAVIIWAIATHEHIPTDSEAFIVSKEFVKQQLNQPTMKFPFMDYRHDEPGNGLYIIESHVDTKNVFGGEVRLTYRVKMRYKGGDWEKLSSWTLEDYETWTN